MPISKNLTHLFIETLEQAIDSVVAIDSQNKVVLFNQAAEQFWGYSKSDVIGQNVKMLVPKSIRAQHDGYIGNNRKTGINKIVGTSRDVSILTKDGKKKWGSMSISKVQIGEHSLFTAFVKDITEAFHTKNKLKLLSLVTDKTEHAIVITDEQWSVTYTNDGFSSLFGYNEYEINGLEPIPFVAPNLSEQKRIETRATLSAGTSIRIDEVLQKQNGEKLWCSLMINPILDAQGKLEHCVTIINDITKTKLHEILHKKILNAIVYDEPHEVVMEKVCLEITKLDSKITPAILKVESNNLQLLAAPDLPAHYRQVIGNLPIAEGVATSGSAAYRGERVLCLDIESDPNWHNYRDKILPLGFTGCLSVPIKNADEKTIGVVALYFKKGHSLNPLHEHILNIINPLCGLAIERELQKKNINQLAYYDALTNLPNRNLLYAKAGHALREAQAQNAKLAILFLDLDRFKQINDLHGHLVGDKLLIEIASRINLEHMSIDTSGRLSGDEFVVVKMFNEQSQLHDFIEELRLKVSEPTGIDNLTLYPSASIGVSVFPEDGHDIGTLIHRADMAMYQAKSIGKGRFAYFSHELNQLAQEVQELEVELEKAIKNNLLKLYYQPQVSMKGGNLYGVEALARWDHPVLGKIPPCKFIPIAEDCGLISELSLWAIKAACKQMAQWRKENLAIPTVSVNLSPLNFRNENLCQIIMAELKANKLNTSDLILELTESVLLDSNPKTMTVLHDIHKQGINFSMDDFGTGYASLSYLRKIPIKELKLDRSFVKELEFDATSQALSRSILQIGESLNLDVVAEGIESEEQLNILKQQGYHVAQGYLFSKPLNALDLTIWLKNNDLHIVDTKCYAV